MKTLSTLILAMAMNSIVLSQNINYEMVRVSLYRLPLKPLNVSPQTYSATIQDLGNELKRHQADSLKNALAIPGFSNVRENAGVHLELVVSPLSITNKELKDNPYTVEKDGVKTVYHKYHYIISYSFLTKLRIIRNSGQVTEQDLPGFFQTKYHGRQADTEIGLYTQFEKDYSFLGHLQEERISHTVEELKEIIFSLYGYGVKSQYISIGYVKDKNGEYKDITKAMSLTRDAFLYATNKREYLDENFKTKVREAASILLAASSESSLDKKARINPKVSGMIHYNLALLSFGLQEHDSAINYIEKIKNASKNTEVEAYDLREIINEHKSRFTANCRLSNSNKPLTIDPTLPLTFSANLQSSEKNYLVDLLADTVQVQFILPATQAMPFGDSVWIQKKVVISQKDDKPLELYPDNLLGFCYNGTYYESLWWIEDITTKPWTIARNFCKRILSGTIPVFTCNEVITDEEGYQKVSSKMYYKKNDQFLEVMFLNFNKSVSKLVSTNQELSEEVRNGSFKREDFLQILKEYNAWGAKSSN
ncbi:MAG: hypothetical protein ABIR06_08180 [Cyclobacteriaceae bacterium]